jgi:hypothetical protein
LAEASWFDPEVVLTYIALFLLLGLGATVFYTACRWFRSLKNAPSTRSDDLAQLESALADEEELDPDERARVRAALERNKQRGETS